MQKISITKSQGKAALALSRIKSKWGRYGIEKLDDPSAAQTLPREELEKIRDEWDASLNRYSEKTIKNAIANYALFDKNKETPPTLEDLEARLAQFFEPDETPTESGDPYLQYKYAEERKKRLTTLRRWEFSTWRNAALRRFYYNGKPWQPAWDNFISTCAQVDTDVLRHLAQQIEQWTGINNGPELPLVKTLRAEQARMQNLIQTERVH